MKGHLIAFEGLDQSGKQTQAERLLEKFRAAGHKAEFLTFPEYKTAIGAEIGHALQGERDYQVTQVDFELWKKALAGRPTVMLKLYPTLNHLFMPGTGPSRPDEYMHAGHVDEQVIVDVSTWIQTKH